MVQRHNPVEYVATRLKDHAPVTTMDGRRLAGFAGEWVISREDKVLDVVTPQRFEREYQPVRDPELVITPADRTTLEKTLGFGSTGSSQSLTLAVDRLAVLFIGEARLQFTVSQWEELHRRAQKRNITVASYLQSMLDRWTQDLWAL